MFDLVGMLGLPLLPCHEFPDKAPAAFFSVHALKDTNFVSKLATFISAGKPVLLTDGLAEQLAGKLNLDATNVHRLAVKGDPKSLLQLAPAELDALRAPLLPPLRVTFRAPNRVAFYLFEDGSWVAENFNDEPVQIEINGARLKVDARGWQFRFAAPKR